MEKTRSKFGVLLLMMLLVLSQTVPLFAVAERYQIINLDLQKYKSNRVTSINNQGWICGLLSDNDDLAIFVLDQDRKMALRQQSRTAESLIINNSNELFGSVIYRVRGGNWIY